MRTRKIKVVQGVTSTSHVQGVPLNKGVYVDEQNGVVQKKIGKGEQEARTATLHDLVTPSHKKISCAHCPSSGPVGLLDKVVFSG